jgi:hypothetical protein
MHLKRLHEKSVMWPQTADAVKQKQQCEAAGP